MCGRYRIQQPPGAADPLAVDLLDGWIWTAGCLDDGIQKPPVVVFSIDQSSNGRSPGRWNTGKWHQQTATVVPQHLTSSNGCGDGRPARAPGTQTTWWFPMAVILRAGRPTCDILSARTALDEIKLSRIAGQSMRDVFAPPGNRFRLGRLPG